MQILVQTKKFDNRDVKEKTKRKNPLLVYYY